VDAKSREEQAGFRKGRSCTDQIATLCIIIEQSLEWQSPLYVSFVDFKKAFDMVDRTMIWRILRHYGIPQKIVNIIYIYIYIYLVDKVPQDITSTEPNIYAHMHKLDKKDN